MSTSTLKAQALGVSLHEDARATEPSDVAYVDAAIPAQWAGGRVTVKRAVAWQAVRHGNGIIDAAPEPDATEQDPTERLFTLPATSFHEAYGTRTVLTLAERNYLAQRSNGVTVAIEQHEATNEGTAGFEGEDWQAQGVAKGTQARYALASTMQQRQVTRGNLRVAGWNRTYGTPWIDLYNISNGGTVRNYTGTVRDHTAETTTRAESLVKQAATMRAARAERGVKCDNSEAATVSKDEACGECKRCKQRERTARSRAKSNAAEEQRKAEYAIAATVNRNAE